MTGPRIPLEQRFWAKVDRRGPEECWLWTGGKDSKGCGSIGAGGKSGRILSAHRVADELAHGPIPSGLHVLRECGRPDCTNPAHMRLVTNAHSVPLEQRLWAGVSKGAPHECWPWLGSKTRPGYGKIGCDGPRRGWA